MGMFGLASENNPTPPNPDPTNFAIKSGSQYGEYAMLEVHYPGCTSYNGNKILVFKETLEHLQHRLSLDPHFLERNKELIARFPSTYEGHRDAKAFCMLKVNGRYP